MIILSTIVVELQTCTYPIAPRARTGTSGCRWVPGRQRGARKRKNGDDSIRESEIFSTSLKKNKPRETAYLVNGPDRSNFRGIADDRA